MSLRHRVGRLEDSMGGRGQCSHGLRVEWPPEDGRPPIGPEVCPVCGLPPLVVRVVYEERRRREWGDEARD